MIDALLSRTPRVLRLDASVFDEAAADANGTGDALIAVFAAAVVGGLGRLPGGGIAGLLFGTMEICAIWGLWTLAIQIVAGVLGERSEFGPLFRALGLAAAPFALALFEGVPLLGPVVFLAKWVLAFATFAVATGRVLRVDVSRSAIICGVALAAALLVRAPLRWLAA